MEILARAKNNNFTKRKIQNQKTMRLLIFFFLVTYGLSAQTVDSTYYEKRDSGWVEITLTVKPFAKVDTLIRNALANQIHDASMQLYILREQLKEKEKSVYELFKRNNRQLKSFTKLPEMPRDTLRGNWTLNSQPVTISQNRIAGKRLNWFSPVVFEFQNEFFIKQESDIWVSDKSRLEKVKPRTIK